MSSYATKKRIKWCLDTSILAAQSDFFALKAEVGKLDINKLVNVKTGLYSLKTKLVDLDAGKSKTANYWFGKIKWCSGKKKWLNTKFNKLDTKVNILENKTAKVTTLIHIKQCNTDFWESLEKKIKMLMKKEQKLVVFYQMQFWIQKLGKLGTK